MYVKLIKKYRVGCKSYSSKLEFVLSSVSVIWFHIKFMTEETSCTQRMIFLITTIHISSNIRTTEFVASTQSIHLDIVIVLQF